MSAVLRTAAAVRLAAMTTDDLDAVLVVEQQAYPFPWSHRNFADSLGVGHPAWVLRDDATQALVGYCVAMTGVGEMHLLNLAIAPAQQGRRHARVLLDALCAAAVAQGARWLWLEVRDSNVHAQAVYRHWQFETVGVRRGYYPAGVGRREDAQVMRLALGGRGDDALD